MDAIIIYPENKQQLNAVKSIMKAMKIAFEKRTENYPEDVISGIKKSVWEAENGEMQVYAGIKAMID